jgi:hypothetical protein
MPRRLFLHIGMHKTGTTSIQHSLKDCDDGTTAYLKMAESNHSYAISMLFGKRTAAQYVKMGWAVSGNDLERKVADARNRLQAQLTESRKNMIVSGEAMSLQFGAAEIARLRAYFAPFFDEIRVIAYLRAPYAYMSSALQETIKRRPRSLTSPPFPNYQERLSPWEDAFGRDAMDYVLYSPGSLAGQDVVTDFVKRIGMPSGPITGKRVNERMSAEAFATLYRLRNGHFSSKFLWPPERVNIVGARHKAYGRQRFSLADSVWPDLTPPQMAEVAWAEQRLGQSFPAEVPRMDALIFHSEAEILDYAAANHRAVLKWARGVMPWIRVAQRRLQETIEHR